MTTVLLVGASGVIGQELVPLLRSRGHTVVGTSRSRAGRDRIEALGAASAELDIYDPAAVNSVLDQVNPDVVICQVTDLPDDPGELPGRRSANARIRREAIPRLVDAVRSRKIARLLVQSVAWNVAGEGGEAVRLMEQATLEAGGLVLRYGQFYGPGTFHETAPEGPSVSLREAADRTMALLAAQSGIHAIVERTSQSAGA